MVFKERSPVEPEAEARLEIDRLLQAAGWVIQDNKDLNLGASLGVAIREFPLDTGKADYLLFVDRKAVGAIEAKPRGVTLSGVSEQTAAYLHGLPDRIPHNHSPLPFGYESTGVETYFTDLRDPEPRSRRVFAFHRPAGTYRKSILVWRLPKRGGVLHFCNCGGRSVGAPDLARGKVLCVREGGRRISSSVRKNKREPFSVSLRMFLKLGCCNFIPRS